MRLVKVLLILALIAAPGLLEAQVVQGRVLETDTGRPIMSAMVSLIDSTGVVVNKSLSSANGFFRLQAPHPGSYHVLAEGLGYAPFLDGILDLGEGGFVSVEFFLRPQPIQLDSLVAVISRVQTIRHLKNMGYYERMASGFGRFITPEDIANRPFFSFADFFRRMPQVRTATGFLGTEVVVRGGGVGYCAPRLIVDGMVIDPVSGNARIDAVVSVKDIAAMEVYTGVAQVPLQYSSVNTCGAIIIWTKGSGGP